jgi:hypothetical protein
MSTLLTSVRSRRIIRLGLPLAALVAVVVALIVPGLGSARAQSAPRNTKEPRISGSTAVGDTLTGTTGEWTGNPTSFKFDWRRCPPDGGQGSGNCDGIVDGPSNTYTLAGYDVGYTIRLQVKAFNSDGKGTATSNATGQVTGQGIGPTNTGLPTVTGTADVGQTLTGSQGSWDKGGLFLANFSYAWLRCDAAGNGCAAFGQTQTTYVVGDADKGHTLRFQVTATNPAGTTVVQSNPTGVVPGAAPVTSPPPPPPPGSSGAGCPAGRRVAQAADVTSPARLLIDRQIAAPLPIGSGRQEVVRYRVSDTCGQLVQGALVYATAVPFGQLSTPAEAATGPNGWVSVAFTTTAGFPLGQKQRSVQIFVRARKEGEDLLAGISARRLFEIPISR